MIDLEKNATKSMRINPLVLTLVGLTVVGCFGLAVAEDPPQTSYAPVVMSETFQQTVERMTAAKAGIMQRHMDLLNERYDLSDRPAQGVTMSRGKAVQGGVRAKLPSGVTWDELAKMTPAEIREVGQVAQGFLAAAAPESCRGRHAVSEVSHRRDQEAGGARPDAVRPGLRSAGSSSCPSSRRRSISRRGPTWATSRKGKLVTIMNYFELFNGILNPKQIEGLRLLVTPFPQQQFNQTDDRRSLAAAAAAWSASIAT